MGKQNFERRKFLRMIAVMITATGCASRAVPERVSALAPGTDPMFEGFKSARVKTDEVTINVVYGGEGPPVLLLHGFPQTHVIWHKIAPALAREFTVVATDLRGYGDSGKPPSDANHAAYAKRAMARDQVAVMRELGFEKFAVVGHDRGGRVAHRLALDHRERVTRLAVLDIVPTRKVYESIDARIAQKYWHWFFLTLPSPVPETLLDKSIDFFMTSFFATAPPGTFTPAAQAEYRRCFGDPETVRAACEDFRASAPGGIDAEHDGMDRSRGISCPLLVLWGTTGNVGPFFDVPAAWRECAAYVRGRAIRGGHSLAEEVPDETHGELREFLAVPAPGTHQGAKTFRTFASAGASAG